MIYANTFMEGNVEQFRQLLTDLECISLQDISEIPEDLQHEIAEQIEQLQDKLKRLNESGCALSV